jgi:hypothetical protein
MSADENANKIHVDQDWKAQAQAEKERLLKKEEEQAREKPQGQRGELPEPDFRGLVGMLASQAIMGLGAMGDPKTGRVIIDLEGARFAIDLLAMLEAKTKGNLDAEEDKDLTQVLAELRNQYVHISQLVAKQQAAQMQTGAEPKPGASKLVQP